MCCQTNHPLCFNADAPANASKGGAPDFEASIINQRLGSGGRAVVGSGGRMAALAGFVPAVVAVREEPRVHVSVEGLGRRLDQQVLDRGHRNENPLPPDRRHLKDPRFRHESAVSQAIGRAGARIIGGSWVVCRTVAAHADCLGDQSTSPMVRVVIQKVAPQAVGNMASQTGATAMIHMPCDPHPPPPGRQGR